MKILFVVDNFNNRTNGTSISASRFGEHLIKLGHEVAILSDAKGNNEFQLFELKSRYIPIVTEVARLQKMSFAKPNKKIINKALAWADVVHAFTPWKTSRVIQKICQKRRIPFTAAFHIDPENITYGAGVGKWGKPIAWWIYLKFRRFYNRVDTIHCPSMMIANEIKNYRYKSQIRVISNGVNDAFFSDLVPQESEMIEIITVGRYAKEKQQSVIIKAIAKLPNKNNIRLTLAGNGPCKQRLIKLAKKLKVNAQFKLFTKEELIQQLRNSHFYVHAANIEIEGISALEAIACGLIPIISNAKKSATKQFAINQDHIFETNKVNSLVNRLKFWLNASPEYIQQAKIQYSEFAQKYRIETSVKMFEEMLNEEVANNKIKKDFQEAKKNKNAYIKKIRPRLIFKIASALFYFLIAMPILWILIKIIYKTKVRGRKNFALFKGRAVFVSNHVHVLDSAMNAMALFPRKPIYTSLPSNFKLPGIGLLVHILGCLPIPTNVAESKYFFCEMRKQMKKGRHIHMYPEGELSPKSTVLAPLKRGPFKVAVESSVPIIPIVIRFTKRKTLILRRLVKVCYINIGKPIYPDYAIATRKAIDTLLEHTHEQMTKLMSL